MGNNKIEVGIRSFIKTIDEQMVFPNKFYQLILLPLIIAGIYKGVVGSNFDGAGLQLLGCEC